MSPHDTVNDERNAQSDSKAGAEFISTDLKKESPTGSSDEFDTIAQGILIDIPQYDKAQTTKVLRKIDYRLVPLLTIIYIISFIDRSNIGNAKVAGLAKDLHLVGLKWNTVLTVFFIPYALLEVPSNIVLKMVRPSIYIPGIMLAWGTVMTLMGLVNGYSGLIAARFFLGVAEAGLFPGATYLLTLWYLRYEVQTRMVIFYSGATLSGAFSGLLAYAIEKMDGIGGKRGWAWIFILEGLLTIVLSVVMYFALPDDPATAKFLTTEEKRFIIGRLQHETGSGQGVVTNNDKMSTRHVLSAFKEWRIWLGILTFWGNSVCVYGFTYTVPSVILGLGYSAAKAQLLTIPIYVCALIVTTTASILSDRWHQRSPVILVGLVIAAIGFIILLAIPHPDMPGLTYGFLFLAASGFYMILIPTVSWIANNLAPSSKRAVGMAILISGGNLGGIAGSNIFLDREAPHYWTGYGYCLAMCIMGFISALFVRYKLQRINEERDRMTPEEINAKYTELQLLDMGDRSPYFRYTL